MHSPLEQFRIRPIIKLPRLFGFNIDFTNSSLFMVIAISIVMFFMILGTYKCKFTPTKKQAFAEVIYDFTKKMLVSSSGESGMKFFPFIFTMFLYIISCNIMGLMPYGFTVTSHLIVTFILGVSVVLFTTVVGIYLHGLKFFHVFMPPGTPYWMMPLMIVIEVLTYFARSFTLAIRLGANMIAGHTMIKVIAMFVSSLTVFMAFVPFAFLIVLDMLELFVAALQAYIFTILTCVYLNSVINLH